MTRLTPADVGCYVDSWWGRYATARMIDVASGLGYDDAEVIDLAQRKLASMAPRGDEPLSDDDEELLSDAGDEVENWLTENVAPEGYSFGWDDGEFFLAAIVDDA